MNPYRKLLGHNTGPMSREAIFETSDAIETVSRGAYEVTRRRVLFEEVLLVTIHRTVGLPFVITTALAALFFGSIALILRFAMNLQEGAITFAILALPFLIVCVIRLVVKLDFVTVFGRRSKAVIRFSIRKRRARETYGRICARTSEVQRTMVEPEPLVVEESAGE